MQVLSTLKTDRPVIPNVRASFNSKRSVPIIGALTILGLVVRMWGVGFGLPGKFRPDEEYIVSHAIASLRGDFNPHFFIYPALYFYVSAAWLWVRGLFWTGTQPYFDWLVADGASAAHLWIRILSALLGTLTIPLCAWLARKTVSRETSVATIAFAPAVAATFLCLSYLHARDSHFAVTDSAATFLVTAALLAMAGILERPSLVRCAGAGLLVGLAGGTKYPCFALGAPLVFSILVGLTRERGRAAVFRSPLALLLAGVCAIGAFAAANPYLFLEHEQVAEDFAYQANWVENGLPGIQMEYGVRWLFPFAIRYALGIPIALLAAARAIRVFRRALGKRRNASELMLVLFLVVCFVPLLRSHLLFFRYVMTLLPALVILAATELTTLAESLLARRCGTAVFLLGTLAIVDPAVRILNTDILLAREDTRNHALAWIESSVPRGATLASHSDYFYAKPQLTAGYSYARVDLGACGAGQAPCPEWVLIDVHPIVMFSPPLNSEMEVTLATKYQLVFEETPFTRDGRRTGLYDPSDAFYVPIAQGGGVVRPGPIIRIYRRKDLP